jgi:hypothetical protein
MIVWIKKGHERTMTVIHAGETALGPETKPDWCQKPSGGFFRLPKEGGEHDCHYHDYNELYLVCRGKAKTLAVGVAANPYRTRQDRTAGVRAGRGRCGA